MIERDRRALLRGGIAVVVGVLLLRVLSWSVSLALAARAQLEERATLLARSREDLVELGSLQDSAAAIAHALVGLAPKLLSGGTTAEAAADLSGRLNLVASLARATLERVDPLPDSAVAGRLSRLRVRATLRTDIRGITSVLQGLESNQATLAVTDFQIVVLDPASADQGPEVLEFEVTVTGWYLRGGVAEAGKGA